MNFLKKHKVLFSFLAGLLVGTLITTGIIWRQNPTIFEDPNLITTFNECTFAGFPVYQNAKDERTCVLPNGKHFTGKYI